MFKGGQSRTSLSCQNCALLDAIYTLIYVYFVYGTVLVTISYRLPSSDVPVRITPEPYRPATPGPQSELSSLAGPQAECTAEQTARRQQRAEQPAAPGAGTDDSQGA